MIHEDKITLNDFWCIGIDYHNTSTETRSQYAINAGTYAKILEDAPQYSIKEIFVISTCNRTEVYGLCKDPEMLSSLICHHAVGDIVVFKEKAYVKNSSVALQHLFNVAGGLESQILGDYEIVGQLKSAFNFAKERHRIGQFFDRLFSTVLQACRAIRSKTKISTGTVSVAYAAVQFLKTHAKDFKDKKILILGVGEIGKNTCKNLVNIINPAHITVINRTDEKAVLFAKELGIQKQDFSRLQSALEIHDIIIVATNAPAPIVVPQYFKKEDAKILIDLSIPNNIAPALKEYPNMLLANVDDLSKINDATLLRRQQEIPAAKALITFYIHEFAEWYLMRQNVPVLIAAKEQIHKLNTELCVAIQDEDMAGKVQKVLNTMAIKLKNEHRPGCNYIEAMNDYITAANYTKVTD